MRVDNQPVDQPGGCGCEGRHTPSATPEPITRPSCLECVEKHLGAAYVLVTESREGYAHRLRAIGHLFEAEDESGRREPLPAPAPLRTVHEGFPSYGSSL